MSPVIFILKTFCRNQTARDRAYSEKFHKSWLAVNAEGYKNGSINSHSITSGEFINEQERLALFVLSLRKN